MHWLALGDSYTIGETVAPSQRWAEQLSSQLPNALQLQTLAKTGWSSAELLSAFHAGRAAGQFRGYYDAVSVLIGVNNQYRGLSTARFALDFAALLGHALILTGGHAQRIVVLTIPDWGQTPFAQQDSRSSAQISAEIDAYNRCKQRITLSLGAHFVEITELTRAPETRALLAEDQLHPSAAMYALWAAAVRDQVRFLD